MKIIVILAQVTFAAPPVFNVIEVSTVVAVLPSLLNVMMAQ